MDEQDWLKGFELVNEGSNGFMYDIRRINGGKAVVLINQDHAFYKNVISRMEEADINKIAMFLACEYMALMGSGYYASNGAKRCIKKYKKAYADAVRRVFI